MSRFGSILSSLNPIAAFFGPIFQKEVRTAGRRRSTYVFRSLYCLGLLAILIGAFFMYRSDLSGRSAVAYLQSMQELAPTMSLVVAWFQFGVLLLAAPVLAAGTVCDERRARSLDVLMATPMRPGQIVAGKLSSRIVQIVILAFLAAPALLAVRIFGGLNAEVVLACSCVAVSTAVLGASLGVFYSVRQRRGTMAALFGVLSLLLLQAAPSMIEGIRFYIANEYVVISPFRENILTTCSPAVMEGLSKSVFESAPVPHVELFGLTATASTPGRAATDFGPAWIWNSIYNLVFAAFVTFSTALNLRRSMTRTPVREKIHSIEPITPAEPAPVAGEPADTDPSAARPRLSRKDRRRLRRAAKERFASRDRTVTDNPVLWREIRQPAFGSKAVFRVVLILTILGLGSLYALAGFDNIGLHAALAYIACAAVMFQSVFLTSGPYAGEREARTWDVLLTTTLTPRQILRGKLLGALRSIWFIPAVVIAHFLIIACVGYIRPVGVLYITLILLGPAIFLTGTGHLLSLRFKRAVTAGALNLAVAVSLWGVLWLSLLILPLMLRVLLSIPDALGLIHADIVVDSILDDHFTQVIDAIFALNPIALTHTAIDPCLLENSSRGIAKPPFTTQLIIHKLSMPDCTLVVLSVFAFYSLGGLAAMALARLRFKRWAGRVS